MNKCQSALPVCGDTVYWGNFEGLVEQCNGSGVLVSRTLDGGVHFIRIPYEYITRVTRAVEKEGK